MVVLAPLESKETVENPAHAVFLGHLDPLDRMYENTTKEFSCYKAIIVFVGSPRSSRISRRPWSFRIPWPPWTSWCCWAGWR